MQDFAPVVVHHVPPDVKEAQAVLRRREAEKARHDRIFDVKQRTIGIDTEALQAQIDSKQAAAAAERERELALDNAMIATARQADVLQQEVDRIKRQQELEIMEYRAKHQAKEQRREWDLNDPDEVKKDTIPTADPSKLGLSSAQLFPGMDQTNDERKEMQAQQQREWIASQVSEKQAVAQAEADEDKQYYQSQMEIQSELNQLISMHENTKQQFVLAAAAENKVLADKRKAAMEAEKAADAEANQADINAALTSAFLNEDPATTVSAANPNRPVPYHYKGLPPEYRQYVLDTQMQQAQAAHQQKVAQSQDSEAWDNFMLSQNTEATKMELAIEREKVRQRKELKEYHLKQAAEISAREAQKEKTLRSMPEESFFMQFGTSSR